MPALPRGSSNLKCFGPPVHNGPRHLEISLFAGPWICPQEAQALMAVWVVSFGLDAMGGWSLVGPHFGAVLDHCPESHPRLGDSVTRRCFFGLVGLDVCPMVEPLSALRIEGAALGGGGSLGLVAWGLDLGVSRRS